MKKTLLALFILIGTVCYSQTTQVVYSTVLHNDTAFQLKITNTIAQDSVVRYRYSSHTVEGYSVIDSVPYMYNFYTITNTVRDSIQINKLTTAQLNNTANFINPTALVPYTPGTRLNDSMAVIREWVSGLPSGGAVNWGTITGTLSSQTDLQTVLDEKANATALPSRVFLPSDVVNNNAVANTIADVTGLSFPVSANVTYAFKFWIIYSSAATTTGSRWSINGPATTFMNYYTNYTLSASGITNNQGLAAYNAPSGANASSLAANNICVIQGTIRPSASGNVIARFSSEIASSAITAIASGRSYVEYQIIN